ncbi:hypothetical protein [Nocardia amamiensis]|uniref:hypothetical protein n=1 Tax=Nocardia amamiensis TaxID=404578 RepID=UPI00082B6EEF|nr:hypothetical protein [Nocardia amamiensis]
MAAGNSDSTFWAAATVSLSLGFVAELAVLAFIMRLRDPDYLRLPVIVFLVPAVMGAVTALALRRSSSSTARGASLGLLTTSVFVLTAGVLAGLLYRGGWV